MIKLAIYSSGHGRGSSNGGGAGRASPQSEV